MSLIEYLVLGYLISLLVTASLITYSLRVDLREKNIKVITLGDLALAVFVSICPVVNTGFAFYLLKEFFVVHAKDIVIYRARDDV
jgi:hypothetical protein